METPFDTSVIDVAHAVGVIRNEAAGSEEADVVTGRADHRRFGTLRIDAVGDGADTAAGFMAGAVVVFLPLIDILCFIGVAGDERRCGFEDDSRAVFGDRANGITGGAVEVPSAHTVPFPGRNFYRVGVVVAVAVVASAADRDADELAGGEIVAVSRR